MIKYILGILAILSLSFWVSTANALFTFSNVSYTSGSVTFTIDGDMTGYALPTSGSQFSLFYGSAGDIYVGPISRNPNTWSRSVFDNKTLDLNGNTGGATSGDYTWSQYTSALFDAAVTNATITVSFDSAPLDESAANPVIQFVWGNPSTSQEFHTVLHTEGVFAPTFTVGGTISGLTGSVTLQNNGDDDLVRNSNGSFTFATALEDGSPYLVTVSSQPVGQTCSVSNGIGNIATANVANVIVDCEDDPTYSVGGNVSGLTGSVALQNNGGDDIIKTTNDGFTFTAQAEGSDYAVTVSSQPTGQTCTITNGSGTNITANITNVTVTCVTDVVPTYTVGGTVSGLIGSVTLTEDTSGEDLALSTNGSFAFATESVDGTPYAVTVLAQPTGQTCSVTNGSGTITTADVTNVSVACIDDVVVPPPVPMVPIPTLSQWALILLTTLLGLMVFANRRRLFL